MQFALPADGSQRERRAPRVSGHPPALHPLPRDCADHTIDLAERKIAQLDAVAGGKIILPADPPVRENSFRTANMLHDTAMA